MIEGKVVPDMTLPNTNEIVDEPVVDADIVEEPDADADTEAMAKLGIL